MIHRPAKIHGSLSEAMRCECGERFYDGYAFARHLNDNRAPQTNHEIRAESGVFEMALGTRVMHYTCGCGITLVGEKARDEHLAVAARHIEISRSSIQEREREAFARGYAKGVGTEPIARDDATLLVIGRYVYDRERDTGPTFTASAPNPVRADVDVWSMLADSLDKHADKLERGITGNQIVDTTSTVAQFAHDLAGIIRKHGGS